MNAQTFRELTYTMRPQDPHGDGTGLRFETGEHGGDYPDYMPPAITVTDAQGRRAVYVPLSARLSCRSRRLNEAGRPVKQVKLRPSQSRR